MASNLKGITIEIGGNTEPLQKALNGVNKTSRSLQVELRQVEKLLKLDPTNTELLVQKQNLLADSVMATSKKLDSLKEAQAQVQAQFERGEIGEEQYRAFQREIIKTENELNEVRGALQAASRNLDEFGDNNGVAREEAERLNRSLEEQSEALRQAEEAQRQHTEEVEKAKKEVEEYKDKVGETAGKVKDGFIAAGLAIKAAVVGVSTYALKFTDEFDRALNKLVTKTGDTRIGMDELNEAMENIYANNFGESIEDVADGLATVRTTLWLNGEELQKITEYAFGFRDAFDVDINESTRAAKALMDSFGISAEESFNMLTQGYQEGLNFSDEFIDSMGEYSVQFKKLGLNVEDMFSILESGSESGAFSLDKVGDAVKELSIRVIDGSDTTKEGFETLGLNADEMANKFAEGGDSAREVIDGLENCDDPMKKNLAGTDLLGSMWEDLGADVVTSLSTANDYFDRTYQSMEELNNIQYDDIGSAINGLGRELQISVIKPVGEDLKPVVEDCIEYVKENSPEIKKILLSIADKTEDFIKFTVRNGDEVISVITGIGAGFVTWKVANMISGLVSAIKALKTANEGAAVSQKILNLAMSSNVVGLLATAVAGLVAGLATLAIAQKDEQYSLSESQKRLKETSESYKELKKSQEDTINTGLSEIEHTQKLWKELQTLADSNGKVKDSNKDRAQFILGELNKALGTEYTMTDNQIDKYKELSSSIDNIIAKKKAAIILEAQEPAYKQAVLNLEQQQIDLANTKAEITTAEMELIKAKDKLSETSSGADRTRLLLEISKLEDNLEKKKEIYDDGRRTLRGYYEDISNYETNATLVQEGSLESLKKVIDNAGQKIKDHTQLTKEELQKQASEYQTVYEEINKDFQNGVEGVTQEMVNTARENAEKAKFEFENAGAGAVDGAISGINSRSPDFINTVGNTSQEGLNSFNNNFTNKMNNSGSTGISNAKAGAENQSPNFVNSMGNIGLTGRNKFDEYFKTTNQTGSNAINNAKSGAESQKGNFANSMANIGASGRFNLDNNLSNTGSIGIKAVDEALRGANSKSGNLNNTMSNIGSTGKANLNNGFSDVYSIGKDVVSGIVSGAYGDAWSLNAAMQKIAKGALASAKEALGIHSPSRAFRDIVGKNIVKGIEVGIDEETPNLKDNIKDNVYSLLDDKNLNGIKFSSFNDSIGEKPSITSNINDFSESKVSTSMPQTAVFNLVLDGKMVGSMTAPFIDVINGGKIELKGRGLII